MDSNKRMAVNTVILYAKLLITIIVNLYSTRIILNAMGIEEFGIVNLISGIVAMLSFVQNSMSVSSQRYMSVNMSKHEEDLMLRVFNSSVVLHICLAIIILLILECAIPFVFDSAIQIPVQKIGVAQVLYQLTIVGTVLVVIAVPFDAALNAHENMLVFSIISIIESLIRLTGAFILVYVSDKLIFYGFLIVAIRLVSLILKLVYCRKHYLETSISSKHQDKKLMKEMFAFAFWNMFGALAFTGRAQGVAIVMNTFLGVVVNAAYGIANQISGQLQTFTATITKAMNPQIMQRGGAGDTEGMISLALKQSKYSSLLLSYAIIPLLFSMPYILKLWLKEIPEYCVAFSSLILIVAMISQTTSGVMSLVQATGKVRNYQMTISIVMLLNIPLSYVLLKIGFSAPWVIVGMVAIEAVTSFARVYFAHILTSMSIGLFFRNVVCPVFIVYIITSLLLIIIKTNFYPHTDDFMSFLVLTSVAIIVNSIVCYFALSKSERDFLKNIIISKIKK